MGSLAAFSVRLECPLRHVILRLFRPCGTADLAPRVSCVNVALAHLGLQLSREVADSVLPGRALALEDLPASEAGSVVDVRRKRLAPSRTRGCGQVCAFLLDGDLPCRLARVAWRPSENSSLTSSRLLQAASCAGLLSGLRASPADLAGIGARNYRVTKIPSDRERFAKRREQNALLRVA